MIGSVGKVLKDSGILSASTIKDFWHGSVHCYLTTGHGVRGLPVNNFSKHKGENEIVFPPNQSVLVTRTEKRSDGGINVHGVLLPFQEGQCCPP